jgi:DNA modification methylase
LQALIDFDFEVELVGFELAEIDLILDEDRARKADAEPEAADEVPPVSPGPPITQPGDLWQLGAHRLICGDARDPQALAKLLGGDEADMIFTDPPYNVPVDGHVGGLGKVKHREFAFASGEMSEAEFTTFLREALAPAAARCREGAIAYVCMDWRHMRELLAAGDAVFHELKNLCVWNKTNAGMGSFYRSKHELVFVWKVRAGRHVNSFGLGDTGRYRTNVWDYAGVNTFSASRDEDLAMHPTVKPVALVGDAIRDCSKRGDIILDMFAGSGSTLIAADQAGRQARLIEYDPCYCDVILQRFQTLTGKVPVNLSAGR